MHEGRHCLFELLLLSHVQAALAIAFARTARCALALCQAPALAHCSASALASSALVLNQASALARSALARYQAPASARSALVLRQASAPACCAGVLLQAPASARSALARYQAPASAVGPAPGVGPCLLRSVLMLCATRCLLSASTPPHHVIPQSGRSSLRPPDSGSHRQYHAQLLLSCQSLPCCQALGSSCDPSACHAFLCADSLYHSSPHSSHSCGESCQPPAS